MGPFRFLPPTLCVLFLLLAASSARADDWLQVRRDAFRSGASRDKTYGPFTEIWSWPDARLDIPLIQRGLLNRSTIRHVLQETMLWNGRAYFAYASLPRPKIRPLVCVDAKTGSLLWTRTLNPLRVELGFGAPALAPSGKLFALDYITLSRKLVGNPKRPLPPYTDRLMIRCISAMDGSDIANHIDLAPEGAIDREDLRLSTFQQATVKITHGLPSEFVSGDQRFGLDMHYLIKDLGTDYGCPLILGEEILTFIPTGMMVRWRPFEFDQWMQFNHTNGSGTRSFETSGFGCKGFAPLSIPGGGVVIGGNVAGGGMLALVDPGAVGGTVCRWHREIPMPFGMPVSAGGSIVVGLGTPGGTQSLLALDARTGLTRWTYAPPTPELNQNRAKGEAISTETAHYPYPDSPGIVAHQGAVYAVVGYSLVALDQNSGKLLWRTPIDPTWLPRSLVASSSHLFLSVGLLPNGPKDDQAALLVYDLVDGKPRWKMPTRELGSVSLANGLVYLSDLGFVHAYAPAERTFRMAVDSDLPSDYHTPASTEEKVNAHDTGVVAASSATEPAPLGTAVAGTPNAASSSFEAPPTSPGIADATILRVNWRTGLEAMLARIRARRKAAPKAKLVLVLEWLDSTRSGMVGKPAGQLPDLEQFAETCAHLAAVGRPTYFEVMSDVNAFLSRYPEQAERVAELIRQTTTAVSSVSGSTRITVSYNAELLTSQYGLGSYLPFGRITRPTREEAARILAVANTVDTLALTIHPRSAFRVHSAMPYVHLLQLRQLFPEHRLLVTEIGLPLNEKLPNKEEDQARYLARFFCASYWLDFEMVAFPRLVSTGPNDADFALRVGGKERYALAEWQRVRQFKRVGRLSLAGPGKLPIPDASRTGIEIDEKDMVVGGEGTAPQ